MEASTEIRELKIISKSGRRHCQSIHKSFGIVYFCDFAAYYVAVLPE